MAPDWTAASRGAVAGVAAAAVMAAQGPLDKRVFGSGYDDVELLGRAAVPEGPLWLPAGVALHLANGAVFGAVYALVAHRVPLPPVTRGPLAGLGEHLALWPATKLSDRFHPRRDELPRLWGNRRAFAQAAWRHLLFGAVLGELERRLNPPEEELPPHYEAYVSSNGHGSLEQAATAEPSAS